MLGLTDLPSCLPCSARGLEKVQQQLQDEVRQVNAQLLEERKKRETHEALARRLQKRNALLTKVQFPSVAELTHAHTAMPGPFVSACPSSCRPLGSCTCLPVVHSFTSPVGITHPPDHRPGTMLAFPSCRLQHNSSGRLCLVQTGEQS